jgi:hypothetical protein
MKLSTILLLSRRFCLASLLLVPGVLTAQAATSGAFVITLGSDTTAVEPATRSPATSSSGSAAPSSIIIS